MDKHSSLLRIFENYGEKKFYDTGPRLQMFANNKRSSLLQKIKLYNITLWDLHFVTI